MARWLVGVLGVAAAAGASAQVWDSQRPGVATQTAPGRVLVSPGTAVSGAITPRTWEVTGTGTGVLRDTIRGPSPRAGEVIDIEVRRSVNWPKISRGIARGLPLLGTAITVAEILQEIRCQYDGGAECDFGQDPILVDGVEYRADMGGDPPWASTPQGAALGAGEKFCQGQLQGGWQSCTVTSYSATSNSFQFSAQSCLNGNCFTSSFNGGLLTRTAQKEQCPAIIVDGVVVIPTKSNRDQKCPTGVFVAASESTLENRITTYGNQGLATQAVPELIQAGIPIEHVGPTIFVPQTVVQGDRTTVTNPDGSRTVVDTSWVIAPTWDGYTWTPRTTSRTYAAGETIPPQGEQDTNGSTVTEGGTLSEVITCGLPGTPPCKIDETGTPTDIQGDWLQQVQQTADGVLACVAAPLECLPEMPSLSWDFALPTGCSVISVPAFDPWFTSIDICQFQPVFHDLMSVVWVLGGLFGAISMFWRKTFAG